ncbi:MAG: GNAT family protein [Pseudomonadota bacterium]
MFAIGFLENVRGTHVLEGERIFLRHPQFSDHEAWSQLRRESREFLQPWEPTWHRNDLGRYAFRERIKSNQRDIKQGRSLPYLIFSQDQEQLLGGITLGHIRRGVSQSAQIGYWLGEGHVRRGYMREALGLLANHAFTRCGLHRLEAACIPENVRSSRLLQACDFHQEGTLRSYLKINGVWRDHILYARINQNVI